MKCTLMVRFYFLSIILFTSTFGQASSAGGAKAVHAQLNVNGAYLENPFAIGVSGTEKTSSLLDPDGTMGALRISFNCSFSSEEVVQANGEIEKKLFLFGHDHSKAAETAEFYLFLLRRLLERKPGEKVLVFLEGFPFSEGSKKIDFFELVNYDLKKHEIIDSESTVILSKKEESCLSALGRFIVVLALISYEEPQSAGKLALVKTLIFVARSLDEKRFLQDLEFCGWETNETIAAPFEGCSIKEKVKVLCSMNESYAKTLEWFVNGQKKYFLGLWRSGLGHLPLWDTFKRLQHDKIRNTSFYQKHKREIDNIFLRNSPSFCDISALRLLEREGEKLPTFIIQDKINSFSGVFCHSVISYKNFPMTDFIAQKERREGAMRVLIQSLENPGKRISSPDRKGRSASQEEIDTTSEPRTRRTCWEILCGRRAKHVHAK